MNVKLNLNFIFGFFLAIFIISCGEKQPETKPIPNKADSVKTTKSVPEKGSIMEVDFGYGILEVTPLTWNLDSAFSYHLLNMTRPDTLPVKFTGEQWGYGKGTIDSVLLIETDTIQLTVTDLTQKRKVRSYEKHTIEGWHKFKMNGSEFYYLGLRPHVTNSMIIEYSTLLFEKMKNGKLREIKMPDYQYTTYINCFGDYNFDGKLDYCGIGPLDGAKGIIEFYNLRDGKLNKDKSTYLLLEDEIDNVWFIDFKNSTFPASYKKEPGKFFEEAGK
ncbi:MAG TPA: hypothetical protein VK177_05190 [Flavobacteriales bacterium]|nr:hypothetical protein [Flavobacteriales bacterium]